jgi:hypothetical protein
MDGMDGILGITGATGLLGRQRRKQAMAMPAMRRMVQAHPAGLNIKAISVNQVAAGRRSTPCGSSRP